MQYLGGRRSVDGGGGRGQTEWAAVGGTEVQWEGGEWRSDGGDLTLYGTQDETNEARRMTVCCR